MLLILSKATLDNVYACFILANGARMEGIEAEIFFTFFGLEAIQKKKMERLHVATVGNPAMHIPTMLDGELSNQHDEKGNGKTGHSSGPGIP